MKPLQIQKSLTHLLKLDYREFLTLCEPHENIATIFGCSSHCQQKSAMCNKKCRKHKRQMYKHKYFDFEDFIEMIEKTRNKYKEFHAQYLYDVIPNYIIRLRETFKEFVEELMSINEETILLESFLDKLPSKQAQCLLTEKIQNWEAHQLSCTDVGTLEIAYRKAIIGTPILNKIKIQNQLNNKFNRILNLKRFTNFQETHYYNFKPDKLIEMSGFENGIKELKKVETLFLEDPLLEMPGLAIKIDNPRVKIKIQNKKSISSNEIESPTVPDNPPKSQNKQQSMQHQAIDEFIKSLGAFAQKSKLHYLYIICFDKSMINQKYFWKTFYKAFLKGNRIRMLEYVLVLTKQRQYYHQLYVDWYFQVQGVSGKQ